MHKVVPKPQRLCKMPIASNALRVVVNIMYVSYLACWWPDYKCSCCFKVGQVDWLVEGTVVKSDSYTVHCNKKCSWRSDNFPFPWNSAWVKLFWTVSVTVVLICLQQARLRARKHLQTSAKARGGTLYSGLYGEALPKRAKGKLSFSFMKVSQNWLISGKHGG